MLGATNQNSNVFSLVKCKVCDDTADGIHFGTITCLSCKVN